MPVPRRVAGLSYEEAIALHRGLGHLAMALLTLHALGYLVAWSANPNPSPSPSPNPSPNTNPNPNPGPNQVREGRFASNTAVTTLLAGVARGMEAVHAHTNPNPNPTLTLTRTRTPTPTLARPCTRTTSSTST